MMRIREIRKELKMTQGELAEKMGVSQNTISGWEKELVYPSAKTLPQLADVLGCTINDLFVCNSFTRKEYEHGHKIVIEIRCL